MYLRQLTLDDCSPAYARWLNDPQVNQYLETKWSRQDLDSIKQFVQEQRESKDSILFAIICNETGRHIGNLKIGKIHPHYHHADLSYFIGDKRCWGKGFATEAVGLACGYGFMELGLNRLEAGTYELAQGSLRVLEKNHFQREGVFRGQVFFCGRYIDVYRYALMRSRWEMQKG